ncbi:MAG TPA: copper ion binding protein, partial [Deinococcales bacterium]|nr:copper ion binding protein [Deinococcales bacterium]
MVLSIPTRDLLPRDHSCSECRERLQAAIASLPGVIGASVTPATVSVEASEDATPLIRRAADGIDGRYEHATITVQGMDCADCARKVQGAVSRIPGIASCQVNFTTEKARIEFDPRTAGPEQVRAAVEPLGYRVRTGTATPATAAGITGAAPAYEFAVPGLHCAGCVRKVHDKLAALPGVSDLSVTLEARAVTFNLDEALTARAEVQEALREGGYPNTITRQPAAATSASHDAARPAPWWASPKGRVVLAAGSLYAAAWALSYLAPSLAQWGFALATLVGGWPFARKAAAAARAGQPFTIESLMTVAAAGALVIGEAAEGALVVFLFAVGELLEGPDAGAGAAGGSIIEGESSLDD